MIKKIILIMIFLFSLTSVISISEKLFVLNLEYSNDEISLNSIYVTESFFENRDHGEYLLKIKSFDNEIKLKHKFDLPKIMFNDDFDKLFDEKDNQIYIPSESEVFEILNESFKVVTVPYFEDAKFIEIYDSKNNLKLKVDVGYYAKICGDNICQDHENKYNCSLDCSNRNKLYVIISFVIIVLSVFFYLKFKKLF